MGSKLPIIMSTAGVDFTKMDVARTSDLNPDASSHTNSNTDQNDRGLCIMCPQSATSSCASCRSKLYCSKTCQSDDWSCHKLLCSMLKDFQDDNRPTLDHRRCLVLSEKDSDPHFMWLAIKSDGTGARGAMDFLMKGDTETSTFKTNQQRCRKMDRHVMVRNREYFRIDGSTPNQSILKATAGLNTAPLLGPFLAFAYTEKDEIFHDFEMKDFRNLIDAFVTKRYKNLFGFPRPQNYPSHGKQSYSYEHKLSRDGHQVIGKNEQGDVKTGPSSIKAIKILCEGEGKEEMFQEVMIPWNHDVFYQGIPSQLAYLVGIPLLCMKLAPRHPFGSVTYSHNNPTMAHLQRQLIKLPEESFGKTPKFWMQDVSNVIVVRNDRKAMSIGVVSSLHDFARDHVDGLLKHFDSEDTNNSMTVDQILAEITPAKFQQGCSVRVDLSMAGLSIIDKEDGISDKDSICH